MEIINCECGQVLLGHNNFIYCSNSYLWCLKQYALLKQDLENMKCTPFCAGNMKAASFLYPFFFFFHLHSISSLVLQIFHFAFMHKSNAFLNRRLWQGMTGVHKLHGTFASSDQIELKHLLTQGSHTSHAPVNSNLLRFSPKLSEMDCTFLNFRYEIAKNCCW